MNRQIIVLGGGFAGMTAAWRLIQSEYEVTVLEARNRVGGRIWSHRLDNGSAVERGGEEIMPYFARARALIEELGLQLYPMVREPVLSGYDAGRRLADHMRRLQDTTTEPISLADAIHSAPLSEEERNDLLGSSRSALTADPDDADITAMGAYGAPEDPADTISYRVTGGNQQIATRIAERIGSAHVIYDCEVASVTQDGQVVTITSRDGRTFDGDAAVVAVPVPWVRALTFDPALPPKTAAAYGKVGFGDAAKCGTALARPIPPAMVDVRLPPYGVFVSAEPDGGDARALSGFAGSSRTLRELDANRGDPSLWITSMQEHITGMAPVGEAVLTVWKEQEYTRGSYPYPTVGWSSDHTIGLRAPHGRIHFAGEHTAGEYLASMEGAIRSGERAASEIITALQRDPKGIDRS